MSCESTIGWTGIIFRLKLSILTPGFSCNAYKNVRGRGKYWCYVHAWSGQSNFLLQNKAVCSLRSTGLASLTRARDGWPSPTEGLHLSPP